MNPIDWIAWIYGKFFLNHMMAGYILMGAAGAVAMMVLFARGVDKYNEQHSTTSHGSTGTGVSEKPELAQQVNPNSTLKDQIKPSSPNPPPVNPGTHIEQHSSGSNSPNIVGNNNQVVINPQLEPRRLSDSQKDLLVAKLSSLPKVRISMRRFQGGSELQTFADDFLEVFKKLDWSIIADLYDLIPEKGSGLGVVVKSQEEHPKVADTLVLAIREMGFKVEAGVAVPSLKLDADEIRFVVAPAE